MQNSLKRMWALLGVVAAIGAVAATSARCVRTRRGRRSSSGPMRIALPPSPRSRTTWAASNGATIQVVTKNFGDIATISAPSLRRTPRTSSWPHMTGPASWPRTASWCRSSRARPSQRSSRQYTLDAFSYGTAVKKLYGIPVQVENIALLVNTKLAKVPTTFAQLETEALAAKKKRRTCPSASASSRARAETRTTCTRSSRVSAATSSAPTRPETSNPKDVGVANPTFTQELDT